MQRQEVVDDKAWPMDTTNFIQWVNETADKIEFVTSQASTDLALITNLIYVNTPFVTVSC